MINSDLNVGGIHRAFIVTVGGDVRIYIPGLTSLIAGTGSVVNEDGTINTVSYNENKETLPRPIWCLPNLEAKQHDEVHPCWVTFDNGDSKRPIIMGFLGKGIKYHAGGSGGSGSSSGGSSGGTGGNTNIINVDAGTIGLVCQFAISLLSVSVTYSMSNRMGNYYSDTPTSLDCSSFVYWCFMKAGLLPSGDYPYTTETFYSSSYFVKMAGTSRSDCESFINSGKLQSGDVLLRSDTPNFGSGGGSHVLLVAPGSYNGESFSYINCTTGGGYGAKDVKGTNRFFNSKTYYAILRYKGN